MKKIKDFIEKSKKIFQKIFNYLKKTNFIKFISLIFLFLSTFIIILNTIGFALIFSDKEKFQEILKSFYGFEIFNYISSQNFYLILISNYLINLSLALLIFSLAYYGYQKKKYFEKGWKYLLIILIPAFTIFSYAFYQSMPKILEPFKKINQVHREVKIQKEEKEMEENKNENYREYQDDGWIIKEKKYQNGYEREGRYKRSNEERYFKQIYFEY